MEVIEKKNTSKNQMGDIFSKYGIYLILVLIILVSSIISSNFFTVKNLLNVSRQISVTCIIALSEMVLLICGEISLAAGAQLCLSGMISIYSYLATGSLAVAVIVGIVVGVLLGAINGAVSCYLGVPAFITTLATNMAFRGTINVWTGGQTVSNIGDYNVIGQGYIASVPIPVIIMIFLVILMGFVVKNTILGRRLLAIGGNQNAAIATGINSKRYRFYAFLISGALAGLAGIVQLSRLNMGIPTAGEGAEMDAIAGAVIGGTSMSGGAGSAIGVLVGSLIIGIINNILNLMSVMSYVQDIIKGIIIILAVLLDMQTKRKTLKQ